MTKYLIANIVLSGVVLILAFVLKPEIFRWVYAAYAIVLVIVLSTRRAA